jgi:ABC-type proline/glycine betaine transport system substrate-binding protein
MEEGTVTRARRVSIVVLALVLALFVAACGEEKDEEPAGGGGGGGESAAAGKDCGTVTINENAWAGSTANVYIAKAVLE